MEVLEQGRDAGPRRGRSIALAVTLTAALVLAAVAAYGLLRHGPAPTQVTSIERTGDIAIEPNAAGSPWEGKLGMPAGKTIPGARIRVRIEGDPQITTNARPAQSSGALHLEQQQAVVASPEGGVEFATVMGPADCAASASPSGLDEAGYRWRRPLGVSLAEDANGASIPLSDDARAQLAAIFADLCAPAGPAPTLTMLDARIDGSMSQRVLDIRASLSSSGDRALTYPLDGPGLRSIGSFERPGDDVVTLLWSVSPLGEDTDGVLDAYVRVITVIGDTAYPWILRVVPPAAIRASPGS